MRVALALAVRGLGTVWPNPAVGCVLARNGRVVGRGWTQPGGRPHAETEALGRAGNAALGATAYVTLEPCCHHGKTPPCTDALIASGVTRVVVACQDPDPRVAGNGIARLRTAGITVDTDVCADEARRVNQGFLQRIEATRPLVTLKVASSLDGRIATHSGASQWITDEPARAWGHGLRARHDAIMVGVGTALIDDPLLTCRLPGLDWHTPVRIVVDSHLRLPLTGRLVRTANEIPTWVIALPGQDETRASAVADLGLEIIRVPPAATGRIDLPLALKALAGRGLTRILVEGGAHLSAALVQGSLVDRIEWFRAPRLIGGDGVPAVTGFGVTNLTETADYERVAVRRIGDDLVESLVRRS